MHLTHRRASSSEMTGISFPRLECWNPMTEVATVAAEVNKKRVLCRISMQILQDQFSASAEAPMRAVAEHRAVIQAAAKKLIEDEAFEEDGSIVIRARDLQAEAAAALPET